MQSWPDADLEPKRQKLRWEFAFWLLLIAGLAVLWRPVMQVERAVTHDPSVTFAGAQAIAAGKAYRYEGWLNEPKIGFYPPVHSITFAPLVAGNQPLKRAIANAQWLVFLEALIAGIALYSFGRWRGIPFLPMAGLTASLMLSGTWLGLFQDLMADFLFLGIQFAWIVPLVLRTDIPWNAKRWFWLSTALGIAYLTRTAALAWLPVLAVAALATRRWQHILAAALPAGVAVAIWRWWGQGTTGYGEVLKACLEQEMGGMKGLVPSLLENWRTCFTGEPVWGTFSAVLHRPPNALLRPLHLGPDGVNVLRTLTTLALLGIAVLGIRSRIAGLPQRLTDWLDDSVPAPDGTRAELALLAGSLLYIGMIVTLPSPAWGWPRYFVPVLPIFAVWIWRGTESLLGHRRGFAWLAPLLGLALLANAGGNVAYFRLLPDPSLKPDSKYSRRAEATRAAGDWLRVNTPASDRVAGDFRMPNRHLADSLRRPLVVDYLDPVSNWQPLSHREQGFARADWVVIEAPDLTARLKSGLFSIAWQDPDNLIVILRVNPAREADFRIARGIPKPTL